MDLNSCKTTAFLSSAISNKFAVKLIGLNVSEVTESDLLNDLLNYISPSSINALMADDFNNFFILFLSDVDSVCRLIQTKVNLLGFHIKILPLVETFVIHCVYPFISNDQLKDIFGSFGTVLEVHKLSVAPNSTMFSHIMSSKCEVTFLLPQMQTELFVPECVHYPPFKFTVRKLCCACSTEGHSLLYCPDIDYDSDVELTCKYEQESDSYGSRTSTSSLEAQNNLDSSQQIKLCDVRDEIFKMGVESSCGSSDTSSTSTPSLSLQDCCKRRLKKLKFKLRKRSSRIKKISAQKRIYSPSKRNEHFAVKVED